MAERIPQSVSYLVVFRAFLASDGKTPATSKTIAITISKNGGAFGNPNAGATNATEISSGFYKFTLDTTDTGTLGPLAWRGSHADINDAGDVLTVANANNAGFAGVPNAAADGAGGLPISDAGGLDLDAQLVTKINDILTDTGTTLQAELDGIQADTEDIQSRLPAALGANGNLKADLRDINGTTIAGTGTRIADAFVVMFNVASSTFTVASVNQTGDSFSRIGATGSSLTSLAPSATALSTAQWTNARAGYLDNINNGTLAGASFPTDPADQSLIIAATNAIVADTEDIQSRLPAALTGDGNIKADTLRVGGTSQTAGDLAALIATADAVADAIKLKTDNLPTDPADQSSVEAAITAAWTTALTEDYAAAGAAATPAELLYMIWAFLSQLSFSGTTGTAKKLDGSTAAMQFTIDSASAPTSITRAS